MIACDRLDSAAPVGYVHLGSGAVNFAQTLIVSPPGAMLRALRPSRSCMRFSCLCGLLACFAGFLCLATRVVVAQAPSQSSGQADSTKYVGVEVCQGCHEDLDTSFRKSAHKATLKNKTAATRGCEGCHGPGAEHVEAGGDSRKIWRFSDTKPETVLERCTRCHEANLGDAHSKAHLSCLTCHSVHHPAQQKSLLTKSVTQLCRGCHNLPS